MRVVLVFRALWVGGLSVVSAGVFCRLGGCIANTGALAWGREPWRPILLGGHSGA